MTPELEKKVRKELNEIFDDYAVFCQDTKVGGIVVLSANVVRRELMNDLLKAINKYLNSHEALGR